MDQQTGLEHQTGLTKDELGHELVRYARVLHRMRSHLSHILPAGLDPAAAQLLAWLVKQGPSRQGELAECTFLDPSTVSRRISQLVQQGLVERRADPVDGRAVQLVPTVRGQEFFTLIQRRREEIVHQVLTDWSGDEISALGTLLRKFNDDFEATRLPPAGSPPTAPTTPREPSPN